MFTLAIFDLFWLPIYPSENLCVDCGAFYEVAFCEPSSSIAIGTFFYSLNDGGKRPSEWATPAREGRASAPG